MDFQWVIFEVFVILLTHFSKEVLSFVGNNVSQSSRSSIQNGPESALDNSDDTCAVTNYGAGNYWRIQFNQTLTVKSVEVRLHGGNYTIEVGNSLKKVSDLYVCASKHLPFPSSKYTVNVSCKPVVRGDVITVNRVDSGPLTLCDFKLRVCGLSTHGEPCPKCTVDTTCKRCDQSHYGAWCEHNCSPGCVPGSCDELTGKCNCITGFTGTHCQLTEVLSFVGNNVSQSSRSSIQNGPESALDNSDDTCAVTNYGAGNYWRIQFNQTLTVKSVELRLKGGNYTIEVGNSLKKVSDRHVCASEHLLFPSSKYTVNVRCKPAVRGDIINIKRVDTGSLSLCDFKLRVCELGSHGKPCPMCTSDSTCRHCDQSHYGDSCEHNCSPGCVPGSCDELTGECNCTTGFNGTHCQFLGDVCANCSSSCLEYEALLGNCTPCQNSIYGNRCDKECSHNCESCDIRNGTCYKCQQNFKGKNCKDHVGSNKDPTFWVLFTFGFLLLITTPILVNRFYKRFQCCKTIQAYFEPPTNLSEHDGERTRFSLSSSRVILEPEGDRRNSNDPYNQAIQVVVTFNSLNAKPQPIEQFVKETHQKMMTNEFRSEFKVLPNGLMNLHTEALKRENITKNRFKKIYPYDANRVILMSSGGSYSGDYINASYIQGVYKEDAYIAAQGPFTEQTIVDFWRMVWQVKSRRIVMLTCLTEDSKEKCMQYWPDDVGEYGPFHVIIQKREVFDKFTIRKFIVRKGEETKRVNHYQFTVWPDTKVPESLEGLLCFRNLTKNSLRSDEGPMIVHGSAGIGRTGTFIALDYLLEKGFKEGSVDVKTCVISLRQQRPFAIQSVDQYAFLHDALVEGFTNISWNCALHVLDEM